jgi:hypothetical protein
VLTIVASVWLARVVAREEVGRQSRADQVARRTRMVTAFAEVVRDDLMAVGENKLLPAQVSLGLGWWQIQSHAGTEDEQLAAA